MVYFARGLLSLLPQDDLPPSLAVLMGFLPAALVIGDGVHSLWSRFARASDPRRLGFQTAMGVATIGIIVLMGARDLISIVNPATVLFSPADAPAMAFIEKHLPERG
ncbi:MAG: hypothetical protein Q8O86_07550, partial [Dehalococcoidia bacterium]|nr:hypothetical protein [Dehalococcoidia bacterium]